MRKKLAKNQRGAALIEAAVTIPIILLISVAIFEFGRAYQTWQVLTNAAREGARVAIIAGTTQDQVKATVVNYMNMGQLANTSTDQVAVDQNVALGANSASQVTISYPFEFIVLNPVARLVDRTSTAGAPITMSAVAVMRNEG